ncbi:MAG: TetR/AcrR family transcriptional regulator [Thermoleophilaceae bacterium]|nr:TetR/AcrR family transcriptional regulator [Thermoleophilaceae bacterium]
MTEPAAARRPRADAARNRERILEVANEAFREGGLEVSVAEIARRAGVGSGTLFRNFPTKTDLIHAIVEMHMNQWLDVIEKSLAAEEVGPAFEAFFERAVLFNYLDRGMLEAVKGGMLNDDADLNACKCEALASTAKLIERAQAAGVLRQDLNADDIYALAAGVAESAHAAVREGLADPKDAHMRYMGVMLAGLRPVG